MSSIANMKLRSSCDIDEPLLDEPVTYDDIESATPDPEDSCAICLETMSAENNLQLTTCPHSFHFPCINQWVQTQRAHLAARNEVNCPLCRGAIDTSQFSTREVAPRSEEVRCHKWWLSCGERDAAVADKSLKLNFIVSGFYASLVCFFWETSPGGSQDDNSSEFILRHFMISFYVFLVGSLFLNPLCGIVTRNSVASCQSGAST